MRAYRLLPLVMMGAWPLIGSAACATSGAVPRPFPGAPASAPSVPEELRRGKPDASTSAPAGATVDKPVAPDLQARRFDGRAVAEYAMGFRGVPYRLGGADPAGFDCSGLVRYVFAQYGVSVPRVVEEQYEQGRKIKASRLKPGDLVFFNTKNRGRDASHVGIALGEDRFLHAPNSTGVVRVETLGSTYWGSRYVGARRIAPPVAAN